MKSPNQNLVQLAASSEFEHPLRFDDSISQAAVSVALISAFRGKFCDAIVASRKPITFKKKKVIYDVGDKERTLSFARMDS